MAARKSAVTTALAEERRRFAEQAQRSQLQINNQVESINRLLEDGSYDHEMAALHERLVQTQMELADAELQLEQARSGSYDLGVRS